MIRRRSRDLRPRAERRGFLVYSVAMAISAKEETTVLGDWDGGGYVRSFIADDGLNGNASWSWRCEAKVFRTLAAAIACAIIVSDHEGVGQAVVLDSRTQERVG